jgi:predicted site-specific integrase-resolvase
MGERLRTPEEVAEALGGHIPEYTIRGYVRAGHVQCIKGPRGKFLFADKHVAALMDYLEHPTPRKDARPASVFGATERSKAARRKA